MGKKTLKIAAAAMACLMSLTLTACNNETEDSSSSDSSSNYEEIPVENVHKVGYIFHESVEDGGFTGELNTQKNKAASRCETETCYIDNVSVTDFETAVKTLVSAGCTDIVAASSVYVNILSSVSGRYMDVNFIGYGSNGGTANVFSYTETAYQGAYIAGMAAAYNTATEKIGVVADTDLLYVIPTINAAALGTQIVYSDATVYAASATRNDEIASAIDDMSAAGCDVIICYTASPYSAEYCQQKGIKFIDSLNRSENVKDFTNMIMYFNCERDSFFLSQFKQMKLDTWQSGIYTGTMANGIVNISGACMGAKDGTQDIINALLPKVTSGKAYIFEGELKDNNDSVRFMQNETMSQNQIYAMDWYVKGVEVLGSYRKPQTELTQNSFEIKY